MVKFDVIIRVCRKIDSSYFMVLFVMISLGRDPLPHGLRYQRYLNDLVARACIHVGMYPSLACLIYAPAHNQRCTVEKGPEAIN